MWHKMRSSNIQKPWRYRAILGRCFVLKRHGWTVKPSRDTATWGHPLALTGLMAQPFLFSFILSAGGHCKMNRLLASITSWSSRLLAGWLEPPNYYAGIHGCAVDIASVMMGRTKTSTIPSEGYCHEKLSLLSYLLDLQSTTCSCACWAYWKQFSRHHGAE